MTDFRVFRVYQEDGNIQGKLEYCNVEDLSPGEVVINVAYSSVNYKDALAATGAGTILRRFPLIAGIDAAGYVVSSENKELREGDAVIVAGSGFGTNHVNWHGWLYCCALCEKTGRKPSETRAWTFCDNGCVRRRR